MPKHKECEGCTWDNYPECSGTILIDGSFMKIDNLKPIFECGQKKMIVINDLRPKKKPITERLDDIESRLDALENP